MFELCSGWTLPATSILEDWMHPGKMDRSRGRSSERADGGQVCYTANLLVDRRLRFGSFFSALREDWMGWTSWRKRAA